MAEKKIIGIYGRGGQGALTAARILANAFLLEKEDEIREGKLYILVTPHYGPERSGGPIKAVVEVSDKPILDRSSRKKPTHFIIFDKNILRNEVLNDLKDNLQIDMVFLNCLDEERKEIIEFFTKNYPSIFKNNTGPEFLSVDASSYLDNILNLNIAMLGYFIYETHLASFKNFQEALNEKIPHFHCLGVIDNSS